MEVRELYKYKREDGGTTVSPIKPNCDYETMYRIIASDGCEVTLDGINMYYCVDTDIKDGWYEIEIPQEILYKEIMQDYEREG